MSQPERAYHRLVTLLNENTALSVLLGGVSLLLFIGTLLAIPLLIISIPTDYFLHGKGNPREFARRYPLLRLVGLLLKNLGGIVFVCAGFVMLFIPGQGLLTIFIGVLLLNFPGKRKLELKLLRSQRIRRGVDWIRHQAGRAPLRVPEEIS